MNYLPNKLLKLRKHYNYSQEHLAKVLRVDVVEYMAYENGRKILNYDQCKKIAKLYHIDVDEIIRNSEDVTLYDVTSSKTDEINIAYFLPKKKFFDYFKDFVRRNAILVGTTIGVVILGILAFIIFNKEDVVLNLALENNNRLSVSEISVVYIDDNGLVKGSGDNSNDQLSNLLCENPVKVATGKDFTIILKADGTLSSSGLDNENREIINTWKNIVDIAAGEKHVVALDYKGNVYACGDNEYFQCEVNDFKNIKKIYASKNGTICLDNEGILYSAGEFIGSSKIKTFINIKDLDTSEDNLVVIDEDGLIEYVAKNKNFLEIYKWQDVIDICCGEEFIAGLLKDGTVLIDCEDSKMKKEVAKWENIIAIDAGSDYLIAFDGKQIYGAGNNAYHQFEKTNEEMIVLEQVGNVNVSFGDNILVSYDVIENASGYEIIINDDENTKVITDNLNASFSSDNLISGNTYRITITTLGDGEYYENSKPKVVEFVYTRPENNNEEYVVIAKLEEMSVEEFKEYLKSIGVTNINSIETGNACEIEGRMIIRIDGISSGQRIAKKDLEKATVTYYICKIAQEENEDE